MTIELLNIVLNLRGRALKADWGLRSLRSGSMIVFMREDLKKPIIRSSLLIKLIRVHLDRNWIKIFFLKY